MARDNHFVVIEHVIELEEGPEDVMEEDTSKRIYNVALWPRKATQNAVVPGERMRMTLERAESSETEKNMHVILAEEVRDVCIGLSTFHGPGANYRTSGLSCLINVYPPAYTGTPAARDIRERTLLEPLQKLRHFKDVLIQGTLPAIDYQVSRQLTHQAFDRGLVLDTFEELVASGDQSSANGDYSIATAYYQRAQTYFHHCVAHQFHVFTPGDLPALKFKIMQHRALNFIEEGDFCDALRAALTALHVMGQRFDVMSLEWLIMTGSRTFSDDRIGAGSWRVWACERIKEGAAQHGQRIKCEDVGRCYYYKSISEYIVWGCEAREETPNDKLTAIACCFMSDTMKDNVPEELLQLDIRTMEKLPQRTREEKEKLRKCLGTRAIGNREPSTSDITRPDNREDEGDEDGGEGEA